MKHHGTQPRSQGLSSLPPLVVGTETLVPKPQGGGYSSTTVGGVGNQVHLVETKTLLPHPSSRFFYHPDSGWSRDQPQPGSLFQRLREAENRDPGNEVADQNCFALEAKPLRLGAELLMNAHSGSTYMLYQLISFITSFQKSLVILAI